MTQPEAQALLRAVIARSGLSTRQFAHTIVVRDSRSVYRWLAGKQIIPETVIRRLKELAQPP